MPRITGVDKSGHPIGAVFTAAHGTTVPGTLVCNGNAVSRTTYALLFATIGITHGSGDGSTTFNLPDYRGRFLRGWANGSANDPDRASRTAANSGGATGDNVGSVQAHAFNSHNHGGATGNHNHGVSDPGHVHGTTGFPATLNSGPDVTMDVFNNSAGKNTNSASTGISIVNNTAPINSDGGNETRPINANVNYLISYL